MFETTPNDNNTPIFETLFQASPLFVLVIIKLISKLTMSHLLPEVHGRGLKIWN